MSGYSDQLYTAHIMSLKQQYLDLMEEARVKKEAQEHSYFDDAKQAFIEKKKGLKNAPQQLSALGMGGGKGEEELDTIIADYNETMEKLKRRRDEFVADYNWSTEKYSRLMENAVAEYNAQIALRESNTSGGKSGGSSKSSGTKSSNTKSTAESTRTPASSASIVAADVKEYISRNNLQPAPIQKRTSVSAK